MKRVLKMAGLCVFALCLVLSGFLIAPVQDAEANGDYIYLPTLTAEITSPASGTTIQVDNCFNVTATITITCPDIQINRFEGFPFIRPVHAMIETCAIENVQATIAIQGNAAVQGAATQLASSGLDCPIGRGVCPSQVTVSWQVCCTGPGAVTITVTPYGEYNMYYGQAPSIFVQPVYAYQIQSGPLPADHLVSDSITITQIPKDDFYEKWLMDSSGVSWAKPHYIKPTNVRAQPQTLLTGQKVTIYVNMANRGDLEGPYTATLKINGMEEAVKSGVLAGNTAVPLEFMVSRDEPGVYEVDVNGQKAFFTVVENTAKSKASVNNNRVLLLLWSFLLVALIIALTILLVRRRRYDS
jgi:hypothetical protein